MRQLIPFKKDIPFKTKVSQINSISLEHTLKLINSSSIEGEFILTGDYKITDVSINLEPFNFNVPFEIALSGEFDDTLKISIVDFYYEIVNDDALRVNIDVLVEGEEVIEEIKPDITIEPEVVNEIEMPMESEVSTNFEMPAEVEIISESERCVEKEELNIEIGDNKLTDMQTEIKSVIEVKEEKEVTEVKNIFEMINSEETFVTYHVHIVQEGEILEEIFKKYNVTKEELLMYNELDNVSKGSKIIIPYNQNEAAM